MDMFHIFEDIHKKSELVHTFCVYKCVHHYYCDVETYIGSLTLCLALHYWVIMPSSKAGYRKSNHKCHPFCTGLELHKHSAKYRQCDKSDGLWVLWKKAKLCASFGQDQRQKFLQEKI